jgi:hypothetical protein
VRGSRLNVRGGPGENFSILGRLEKGTTINIVGERGEWLKIEPTADIHGFVAAHLLSKQPGGVVSVKPPSTNLLAEVKTNLVVLPTNIVGTATNPVVASTNLPTTTNIAATLTNQPPTAVVETNVPGATNLVVVRVNPPTPDTNQPPVAPPPPPEAGKRIVTREGLLKGSFSIQAPAYFELRSLDNNRVINYVWSPSTNVPLKGFKGRKVLITGEELLDERWPNTPVLNVDQIRDVP